MSKGFDRQCDSSLLSLWRIFILLYFVIMKTFLLKLI